MWLRFNIYKQVSGNVTVGTDGMQQYIDIYVSWDESWAA